MADPLGIAASIIAVLELAKSTAEFLRSVKDASKQCKSLLVEISSIRGILTELNETIKSSDDDNDGDDEHDATQDQQSWSLTFTILLESDGPLKILQEALEELDSQIIERQKSLLALALENDHFLMSQNIQKEIVTTRKKLQSTFEEVQKISKELTQLEMRHYDEKSRHILEWIAPMNFSIAHIDIMSQRREKFGEWFLKTTEYKDWLGGVSQISFCKGIPGAGKTYLASLIIDHLRGTLDETVGMAWTYCNYTERKSQSTLKLTSSLLRQLAQGLGDIPRNIQDLYEAHSSGQVPLRLSEVKQALMSVVTAYDRVFLVVDALDECDDTNGTRDTFTEELLALPAHVQILVTSRPIKNIEEEFSRSTNIEIRAQDEDIKNYVNLRNFNIIFPVASRGSKSEKLVQSDTDLQNHIIEAVVERCQGMFLMAKLHLDSLARKAKYHKNAVLKMIDQLPHELDTTYQNAMERVLDQETDE